MFFDESIKISVLLTILKISISIIFHYPNLTNPSFYNKQDLYITTSKIVKKELKQARESYFFLVKSKLMRIVELHGFNPSINFK